MYVCVCVCVYTHDFSRVYCAGELSTNLINNSIFVIWRFSTAWYGTVRHGSVWYGSVRVGLHFHGSLVPL